MSETKEQRAELAAQLAAPEPHEVPLNFLNPRPGTPLENQGIMDGKDAVIVGNYLTTLGRPANADLELLVELNMPIKELQKTL